MNDPFRADLHCHTTCSDGVHPPREVVALAAERGLSGLSITDHDTIAAYAEALPAAREHGILLLPGVEFSAAHLGEAVHILGYGFQLEAASITELCARQVARRRERNASMLLKLKGLGIKIAPEELGDTPVVGRMHMALLLVRRGVVATTQEAFAKYLGEGGLAYVASLSISAAETLEAIHAAGGKAVLAHPHLMRRKRQIRALLKLPFDGIECYYGNRPPEEERRWVEEAERRGLIATGGSDFHGEEIKPYNPLGCAWVGREIFTRLCSAL